MPEIGQCTLDTPIASRRVFFSHAQDELLHFLGDTRSARSFSFLAAIELTFRTLFRPSEAIFEEPRVESGAGVLYRPCHAL